jgi:hypothetical protein
MPARPDPHPSLRLLESLNEALAAAEAAERDAKTQLDAAKAAHTAATAEVKKHRTMLVLYTGKTPGGSLNKDTVRPVVERLLASGPLPEKDLLKRLESEVKAQQISLSGLALVVRPLRKEFAAADGNWSLPASVSKSNHGRPVSNSDAAT